MPTTGRSRTTALLALACLALATDAAAEPRRPRPRPATQADVDRLEAKLAAQQRLIEQMIALQRQYLASMAALVADGSPPSPPPAVTPPSPAPTTPATNPPASEPPAPAAVALAPTTAPRPAAPRADRDPPAPRARRGVGTVVGKVTGAPGAVLYVEDIVVNGRGTASMKQQGKQFVPGVLVVQKGTKVAFPNLDAIFHNVFSVSPASPFDLGSYPQGESRTVTMSRPGVVTVYCNMHPQMVGHILVVPNGNFVRAGADGFFRLGKIPAGSHRLVAWAPNAQPARVQINVGADEVVTVEVKLTRSASSMHTRSDGLPYGSYDR